MSHSPPSPRPAAYKALCLQPGIPKKNPNLLAFLPEIAGIVMSAPEADAVIGWGRKQTSAKAISTATSRQLPYLALEDGFLRSLGLGFAGEPPLSLVVDRTGIYYDATTPSDLENLIIQGDRFSPSELARARHAMAALRQYRLSKYNSAPDREIWAPKGETKRILVVDQTFGDASIEFGMASPDSFTAMLEAAIAENPGAEVVVKTHPDVVAGKKRGYLTRQAQERGCRLIAEAVNPWSVLDGVDKVYVVTSQLGFEALMAGIPVRCFGMPFYAGWGLTEDELICPRRTVKRSLEEVFAAAYIAYPRYVDPFTNQLTSIERIIEILAAWKQRNELNSIPAIGLGISRWKRQQVGRFLYSTSTTPKFVRSPHRALKAAKRIKGRVIVWAAKEPEGLQAEADRLGVPLWRMEDGFVRSVGLGAEFTPAYSLVLDSRGMYFDPRQPSDLEHILQTTEFDPALLRRARALIDTIVSRGISKYNVGAATPLDLPKGQRIVLVPGQVEDDQSVQKGCPDIRSNHALLKAARQAEPDAFILFKPHPDVESGLRKGAVSREAALEYADIVVSNAAISAILPRIDAVHTMTSLVGFEALLRNREVFTYGIPFYAGWGLTKDRHRCERRTRILTIEQLVAGTLLLYPIYIDPVTKRFCDVETVIQRFSDGYRDPPSTGKLYRRMLGRLLKRLTARQQ